MPELIVPVLNEIFGTNYPLDVPLEQLRNEHQTLNGEKITDSYFRIGKKGYHFECQSTGDIFGRTTAGSIFATRNFLS